MIGQHIGRRLCALTLGVLLGATTPWGATEASAAQPVAEAGRFEAYFAGLKAGELRFAMRREAGQYAASGEVKSTG